MPSQQSDPARAPRAMMLAAGLGTRLRPLTERVPKCLLPVAGRPLLEYWQATFARDGIRDVRINVHAHAEQVRSWVTARNAEGPVRWSVFEEPQLLGSAGTLRANLSWLEEGGDFLAIYADNVSAVDLRALATAHAVAKADFTMALFDAPDPSACGIATVAEDGRIERFVEKPEEPDSTLANAGIYAVRPGVLGPLLGDGFSDMGFDVLPRLEGRMHAFALRGYHRDVGTPEGLRAIEDDLASGALAGHFDDMPARENDS
jgi:mannose-1-phosphate guanylyltransferase